MTSIFDVTDWSSIAPFLAWTLAVSAVAKAIFGSFPAAELGHWLAVRDAPRKQRIVVLNWEVTQQARWDEALLRKSQHAAPVALTADEVSDKRRELQALMKSSLAHRAVLFLMNCWACQTFWAAVIVFLVTRGVSDLLACVFSSLAYSGAAVVLMAFTGLGRRTSSGTKSEDGTCKTCGGQT